ncbi:SprT family protein [Fructobacillus sp. M158]|uniref:SprT family protein n=1 Tax=Fructobacillus parabroussonetiae TaxID=2713174 RepID=UPI00200A7C09|nr:SprT family protein [Fructobacillus parabroussonetiae]MCK8616757.1 SprT family protein [Fructobacillus parabroussonetiae]
MPEQVALQERVEQVSLSSFGQPFRHVAVFNRRLQTTGGRYHLSDHHLDFNPKMAKRADFDAVIKHELCHYHLHLAGRGYRHRDQDFKRLLQQVGGSRYAPDVGARRTVQRKYHYLCENGHSIDRVRPVDVQRYRCGRCRGRLYPR